MPGLDMSMLEVTDAPEMPKTLRTRKPKPNPFTDALKASDAERHDETRADGRVVSLGKPKQTAPLSTQKPEFGGPSPLDTARNLVRRAGDDLGIGVITRLAVIDENTARIVFQASDRKQVTVVTPSESSENTPASAEKPADKPATEKLSDKAEGIAGAVRNAVAGAAASTTRTREGARRS